MAKAICVREGSIRQLADATAGEGVSARTPSVRATHTRRARWMILSRLVMRLLAIFISRPLERSRRATYSLADFQGERAAARGGGSQIRFSSVRASSAARSVGRWPITRWLRPLRDHQARDRSPRRSERIGASGA